MPPEYTHIHIVPVIFAVSSKLPPFDKVAITSVQMKDQQILPLRQLKYDWVPYVTPGGDPSHASSRVFLLTCNQRRSASSQLTQEKTNQFTYAVPYIFNPFKNQEEEETVCTIPVEVKGELKPYEFDYVWGNMSVCIPLFFRYITFHHNHLTPLFICHILCAYLCLYSRHFFHSKFKILTFFHYFLSFFSFLFIPLFFHPPLGHCG